MFEVIPVALVGALLSLDRTAFLQIMVSQPIVAGPLIGFLLGDAISGLTIGGILELLWVGNIPVGSSIPPNETMATVIAVAVTIILGRDAGLLHAPSMPLMVFSILLSIPLAMVGQGIDISVRNYNKRFVANADRLLEAGDLLKIDRENLKGLLSFFAASFFSMIMLIGIGLQVTKVFYSLIPEGILKGFSITAYLLVSLGIAVSIRTAKMDRVIPTFAAGFLLGLVLFGLKR